MERTETDQAEDEVLEVLKCYELTKYFPLLKDIGVDTLKRLRSMTERISLVKSKGLLPAHEDDFDRMCVELKGRIFTLNNNNIENNPKRHKLNPIAPSSGTPTAEFITVDGVNKPKKELEQKLPLVERTLLLKLRTKWTEGAVLLDEAKKFFKPGCSFSIDGSAIVFNCFCKRQCSVMWRKDRPSFSLQKIKEHLPVHSGMQSLKVFYKGNL